ncbi:MAG: hypothetical protein M8349_04790 [ANME-2 cluster archaeon]|nr:hypothetical protein [ANME-2 cluster archaeon]
MRPLRVQQIHINRNRVDTIEFDFPEIAVPLKTGDDCSFEVVISNYGSPTHVHLSASDSIRKHIKFLQDNPYVVNQEYIPIVVNLPEDIEMLEGDIKVTTGYGAHTEAFKITIGAKPADSRSKRIIDVDERLGTPLYIPKAMDATTSQRSGEIDTYSENGETMGGYAHQFETFIVPLLLVLIAMVILLATFTFSIIDKLTGAVASSIIFMVILVYAALHLYAKK